MKTNQFESSQLGNPLQVEELKKIKKTLKKASRLSIAM